MTLFCPIIGYGLEVEETFLDRDKVSKDESLMEIIAERVDNHKDSNLIAWATTGDMYADMCIYVYCLANMPWEDNRGATKEDVGNAIYQLLSPILSPEYTKEAVFELMQDIYDCGCA